MNAASLNAQSAQRSGWIEAIVLLLAAALSVWSNRVAARSRRIAEVASAERSTLSVQLTARDRSDKSTQRQATKAAPPAVAVSAKVTDFDLAEQSAQLRLDRAIVEEQYEAFFRQHSLTPAQREQWLGLRSRYQQDRLSAELAAKSEGLPENAPAIVQLLQKAKDRLAAAETDLLGDDSFRDLQEYERTLPIRTEFIEYFAADLAFTDAPLRASQAEKLVRVIDSATSEPQRPNHEKHVNWTTVVVQSDRFLSAQQIAVLSAFATTQRRDELIAAVREFIAEPPPDLIVQPEAK